jgi:pimeloyl-ACP methyl ester carboxylesterase
VPERLPLVFFQHFMGTLDDHDPALSDAFAADREVILFNNTGVASSSGTVPGTIEAMARDAITFIDALGLTTIDVVGHSMGGLVAQEVALARPELVRRLVLAGTGPRGGEGVGALPAWVAELFTTADLLTPQQARIASLAARGLTNKEIGRELHLSPRTVSTHLYQIFPKLNVTSRAGLRDALSAPVRTSRNDSR